MVCPTACADIDLISIPADVVCDEVPLRENGVSKLGFFLCSTSLPSPLTCANLEPLVTAKSVVFTQGLSDVTFSEPQTEDIKIDDCSPSLIRVVGRTLTFNDKRRIRIPAIADPATPANDYFDRDFYKNKQQLALQLRFMIVYCDGTIEVPKDTNGDPLSATFNIYRDQDRNQNGNIETIYEVKRATIQFKGDPLQMVKPDLNLNDVSCDTLKALIG